MSKDIENKVVSIEFDNSKFEKPAKQTMTTLDKLKEALHFKRVGESFDNMTKAIRKVTFEPITKGIDSVYAKFTYMERFTIQLYDRLANKIINTGKMIANETFVAPIRTGKSEYELKMGAVQTIMASSKRSLTDVNKVLAELNKYADDTIYSFSDMTQNIGKFTNAGVELEDAVAAIKGISNEAALAGANANEASRAMYNFSQALSTGSVKLIDWKSIENANMATVEFKKELIETAEGMNLLTKGADGLYRTLEGKAFNATVNFNNALQDEWITSKVLIETLKKYASEETDVGIAATKAATEVKTFSMLLDTLKEALQSGWAETWELIIGDFERAKDLWAGVSKVLGGLVDRLSTARNTMLKTWASLGARESLLRGITNLWTALTKVLGTVRDGFRAVFPPKTGAQLAEMTRRFELFTRRLIPTRETIESLRHAFRGLFSALGIVVDLAKAAYAVIGPLLGRAFNYLFGKTLGASSSLGDWLTKLRQTIREGQVFQKVFSVVGTVLETLGKGFRHVFDFISNIISAFKVDGFTGALRAIKDGFFNLLKGIWELVKKYNPIRAIKELGVKIGEAISQWPVGRAIKNVVVSVKNYIADSPVWKFCVSVVEGFVHAIQAAINKFRNVDTSATNTFTEKVKSGFGPLSAIGRFFSALWKGIVAVWETVAPVLKNIGKQIKTAFTQFFATIKGVFDRSDATGVGAMATGVGFGAVLLAMAKTMWSIGSIAKNVTKTIKGLRKIMDSVAKLLTALKFEAYARSIKQIAVAVALLAGSLFVLAALPADSVVRATAAIMMLFQGLVSSMTAFSSIPGVANGAGAKGFLTVGAQILAISVALGIIVANLIILALLPYEGMIKGLTAVLLMTRMLASEAKTIGETNGTTKAFGTLIGLGLALHLLTIPLIALSVVAGNVEVETFIKAVGSVIILVGALGAMVAFVADKGKEFPEKSAISAIGRAMLGIALAVFAIVAAITALTLVLGINKLTGTAGMFEKVMRYVVVLVGIMGEIAVAIAAIAVMAQKAAAASSKIKTSKQTRFSITKEKGLTLNRQGSSGAGLGIFAPMVGALLGVGAAMVLISAATAVLAVVVSNIDEDVFTKVRDVLALILSALIAVAAVVLVVNKFGREAGTAFSAELNIKLFPTMAAYILAVAGMIVAVAGAAKLLKSVNNREITIAIGLMASMMLMIGALGSASSNANFAKGLQVATKSLLMFAGAIAIVCLGIAAIIAAIGSLTKMTGGEIDKFADNLDKITEALRQRKDSIVNAVAMMAEMVVEALVKGISRGVIAAIREIGDGLNVALGTLIDKGWEILTKVWTLVNMFLASVADNAPAITEKLVIALINVIRGLATAIDKHHIEIIEAINAAIEAILKVLIGLFGRLVGVAKDGIDDFIKTVMPYAKPVATALLAVFAGVKLLDGLKKVTDTVHGLGQAFRRTATEAGNAAAAVSASYRQMTLQDYFGKNAAAMDAFRKERYAATGKAYWSDDIIDEGDWEAANKAMKQAGKSATSTMSKVKMGLGKAVGAMAVAASIGSLIAGRIDAAGDALLKETENEKHLKQVMAETNAISDEYNRKLVDRKNRMDAVNSKYQMSQYLLNRIHELIGPDGKIIKGRENEFDELVKIAGLSDSISKTESGLVEIIGRQGEKYKYNKDLLEETLKKKQLAEQIESQSDSYQQALEDRRTSKYEKQLDAAKKKLEEFQKKTALVGEDFGLSLVRGMKREDALKTLNEYDELFLKNLEAMSTTEAVYQAAVKSGLSPDRNISSADFEILADRNELRDQKEVLRDAQLELDNLQFAVQEAGRALLYNESVIANYENAMSSLDGTVEEAALACEKLRDNVLDAEAAMKHGLLNEAATPFNSVLDRIKQERDYVASGGTLSEDFKKSLQMEYDAWVRLFKATGQTDTLREMLFTAGLEGIGEDIWAGLVTGVKSASDDPAYKKELSSSFDKVESIAKETYDINSPSKVFEKIGGFLTDGLAIGIDDGASDVEKSMKSMAAASLAAYTSASTLRGMPTIWTPLVDMSGIQNGSADIRRQLSGVASGNIGTSLTSNLAASLDMSVLTLQNREIVESVRALQGEVITLKDLMASLQVVLDSGVLVGELAGSMDLELGRLTSRKERGVNK